MTMDTSVNDVAFYLPSDKYVYRTLGKWRLDAPVNKTSLRELLHALQWDEEAITDYIKDPKLRTVAGGHDCIPNAPPVYLDRAGMRFLNTWVPPTIVPTPGEFPTIQSVLDFFTEGPDKKAAQAWILNWMAYKVQDPSALPKVAIVFASEQGGGKGFLGRVLSEILGPENCACVKQSELEARFNSRWIGKLFILGDEIISGDHLKDISQKLKILVDGNELEREGKNANQTAIRSRLAWMFASNDRISPVLLEPSDRRYAVFTNHRPVPAEHKAAMNAMFENDRVTATESFRKEIAAFAYHLHSIKVDYALVGKPYENEARAMIIAASRSSVDAFCDEVDQHGIEQFLPAVRLKSSTLGLDDEAWVQDIGDGWKHYACSVVYAAYQVYCTASGQRQFKSTRLGVAIKNRPNRWERIRRVYTHKHRGPDGAEVRESRRVWCYALKTPSMES